MISHVPRGSRRHKRSGCCECWVSVYRVGLVHGCCAGNVREDLVDDDRFGDVGNGAFGGCDTKSATAVWAHGDIKLEDSF